MYLNTNTITCIHQNPRLQNTLRILKIEIEYMYSQIQNTITPGLMVGIADQGLLGAVGEGLNCPVASIRGSNALCRWAAPFLGSLNMSCGVSILIGIVTKQML